MTCQSVIDDHPVLVATNYDNDQPSGFMDGTATAMLVVAMSEVLDRHPDLEELAGLPPCCSATSAAVGKPSMLQRDDWDEQA